MNDQNDILISLKPKHAKQIFCGAKTVELRRRKPNVTLNTRVWIYVTSPVAAIEGHARLAKIVSAEPFVIWKAFGQKAAVSKSEFDLYFEGANQAHALVLKDIMMMEPTLDLVRIRELVHGFQPPQFYCRLNGTRNKMRLPQRKYRPINAATQLALNV